jgi:photosystem II stability/assembly factor-like uncharacterized protein
MNTTTGDARLNPRARRAILLILAAVLVTAGTSVVYLKPSLLPHAVGPARAVGPALLSSDYQATYSFLTPSLGWALVAETTIATPRFSVFKTTDTAKHWKRQLIRNLNQAGLDSFMVQFFDPSHGVIAIGSPTEIYRTSDGGAHWALVKTPTYLHSFFAPADPVHGWLLGWTSQPNESLPNLYSTSDGGDTWTALPQIGDRYGMAREGPKLSFRNPREGWFGASAAAPTVYESTDGGLSWQPHTLPSNLDPNLCPTTPAGALGPFSTYLSLLPGHGVVAILNDYCAHVEGYTSVDGGATWRALASPPGATSLWDFAFQDSSHWWAMRSGELWKSADAGLSWKLISQQTDNLDYFLHVIDAKHAWAELFSSAPSGAPGAGLAVTSDGGLHWSQVSTPTPG